jgi:hypothetical protein
MAGGAADKSGNQYEHWWTANRIADILIGRATRIRLEPPGIAGQGIEFEIDQDGRTWAEQVKDASAGGNWTINRLNTEGVLAGALVQLSAGRAFRFVASTAAPQLATFCRRSRETQTLAEFESALSNKLQPEFRVLVADWAVTPEEARTYLQSLYVDHFPPEALRALLASGTKHLFADDPELVLAELRSFCDDHMHLDLTAPMIWAHMEAKGFHRRHLAGDQTTIAKLHNTVERHGRRVDRAVPDIGLVASSYAAKLIETLRSADGKQVAIVDGRAGHGKSTVVAEVARTLEAEGWFVAVARMDTVDASATTSIKLGNEIGLGSDSPGVLIGGVADGAPALLVIDQLDAVSTYSGRLPDVFDAVDETLAELSSLGNVKVVLVVRTVDLEADPRLRRLNNANRADRVTIGRLAEEDVRVKLVAAEVPLPTSQATLDLLRTPLHLTIFLRLSATAQQGVYPTLQNLYDKYTEELRTDIGRDIGHLDWIGITGLLVTSMNDHERLNTLVSVLDSVSPDEWHALESAALLVRDADTIAFFHESYFDYLFARTFVLSGRSLLEFLTNSGQHLFRRAQTRQVLEHLVGTDRPLFRATVAELLAAPHLRSHLKEVIIDVLGQVEPSPEDWVAVDAVAWSADPTAWRLLALLNRPAWFEVVDSLGKWPNWLADPERVDRAFHQLRIVARERPARVVELVRPFIGASELWRLRLKSLVEWALKPGSTDFAVELIARGDLDDARGPIAVNSDFWSIVYGVAQDDKVAGAKLVGAFLDRGLVRAQADGAEDPFESEHLSNHSQSDDIIRQIAVEAPEAYLEYVLPFVLTVAVANQQQSTDRLPIGGRWAYRHHGSSYSVDDKVFEGTERALQNLAVTAPDKCDDYLLSLVDADSEELRFLACRTLTVRGPADAAVAWLIDDPRNLVLGWIDSALWATRELIEAWSSTCSADVFARLEQSVRDFSPGWESHPRGRARYQLLSALDRERMSAPARRELEELKRRFPSSPPSPPVELQVTSVGSPIADGAASRMGDDDWLRALRKYSTDRTEWKGLRPIGGAHELAQVLGRRAEADPNRFADLALKFDEAVHPSALDSIIRAIAPKVEPDVLADVCEHAKSTHGSEVGRAICSSAQQMTPITPRMLELVVSYADDSDPDREWANTQNSAGQTYFGGDLDSAGLNSTRGQAGSAAATGLFQSGDNLDLLGPVIERLAADPVLGVRAYAAEGVIAMMNHDEQRAYASAETLLDTGVEIFASRGVDRLLTYLIIRQPERFAGALARALAGPDPVARRAGHVWAQASARDGLPSSVPQTAGELSPAARRGAAEMFATSVSDAGGRLAVFFDDEDEEVRKQASWAMRRLEGVPVDQVNALIADFISSQAFSEHFDDLVDELVNLPAVEPETSLVVCERAVTLAGSELGDIRTSRSMMGQSIMQILLPIYRRGNAALRSRCLDVIDRLSEANAYGVSEALQDER